VPLRKRDLTPGLQHVWINATGNWSYFLDQVDRMTWIRILVRVAGRCGWTVVAFCQMTTHVHLVLAIPDPSLAAGMQFLNREYSKDFNLRHDRYGQLVRRRYGSRRIVDGRDLLGAFMYVVLNPVEAGLVPRAEDWRWSSYATTVGVSRDFPFVDASLVVAEAGGVTSLQAIVDGELEARLSRTATSGI